LTPLLSAYPFAQHPSRTIFPIERTSASVRLSASESADGPLIGFHLHSRSGGPSTPIRLSVRAASVDDAHPLMGARHRMCRLSSQLPLRRSVDAHPFIRSRSIR
jgi:hypothetical protein